MARKTSSKSKLPDDPSEPALPVGFGPAADSPVVPAKSKRIRLDERAAAPPSLSDLRVPVPQPPPAADDIPYAEEVDDPPTSEEDRIALAKRLAQEALQRAISEDASVNRDNDPVDLDEDGGKDDGVDLDDTGVDLDDTGVDLDDTGVDIDASEPPADGANKPIKRRMSLAERARRPKSAKDVIAQATTQKPPPPRSSAPKAEKKASSKKAKSKSKSKAKKKAKKKAPATPVEFEETSELMAQADQEAAVVQKALADATVETPKVEATEATVKMAAPKPKAPRPTVDPAAALSVLGEAKVKRSWQVDQRPIFAAMWTAHRAHAVASGNLPLAGMASVLLDAADRVPEGKLMAMEVELGGNSFAVWVDADRGCVLGVASPPSVWLVGL